ncbi:hypothetical protein B0H11DRAFT_1913325 [Mycena galericulata]|nr:hypothetical protein B0H11DRAFT_1913325 [Mycena galericulata]
MGGHYFNLYHLLTTCFSLIRGRNYGLLSSLNLKEFRGMIIIYSSSVRFNIKVPTLHSKSCPISWSHLEALRWKTDPKCRFDLSLVLPPSAGGVSIENTDSNAVGAAHEHDEFRRCESRTAFYSVTRRTVGAFCQSASYASYTTAQKGSFVWKEDMGGKEDMEVQGDEAIRFKVACFVPLFMFVEVADHPSQIRGVIIQNCLAYSDQRLVVFACLCAIRGVDSCHSANCVPPPPSENLRPGPRMPAPIPFQKLRTRSAATTPSLSFRRRPGCESNGGAGQCSGTKIDYSPKMKISTTCLPTGWHTRPLRKITIWTNSMARASSECDSHDDGDTATPRDTDQHRIRIIYARRGVDPDPPSSHSIGRDAMGAAPVIRARRSRPASRIGGARDGRYRRPIKDARHGVGAVLCACAIPRPHPPGGATVTRSVCLQLAPLDIRAMNGVYVLLHPTTQRQLGTRIDIFRVRDSASLPAYCMSLAPHVCPRSQRAPRMPRCRFPATTPTSSHTCMHTPEPRTLVLPGRWRSRHHITVVSPRSAPAADVPSRSHLISPSFTLDVFAPPRPPPEASGAHLLADLDMLAFARWMRPASAAVSEKKTNMVIHVCMYWNRLACDPANMLTVGKPLSLNTSTPKLMHPSLPHPCVRLYALREPPVCPSPLPTSLNAAVASHDAVISYVPYTYDAAVVQAEIKSKTRLVHDFICLARSALCVPLRVAGSSHSSTVSFVAVGVHSAAASNSDSDSGEGDGGAHDEHGRGLLRAPNTTEGKILPPATSVRISTRQDRVQRAHPHDKARPWG